MVGVKIALIIIGLLLGLAGMETATHRWQDPLFSYALVTKAGFRLIVAGFILFWVGFIWLFGW